MHRAFFTLFLAVLSIIASVPIGNLFHVSVAEAADTARYVRKGATGSGNGSDWSNAYTELNQASYSGLSGGTLYIAAGSYTTGLPDVNIANVTIQRATTNSHGTDTGWSDVYDGQVTVTPSVGSDFLTIGSGGDGTVVDGMGFNPWKFRIAGTRGWGGMVAVGDGADNVIIRGLEIDGLREVRASGDPEDGVRWYGGNNGIFEHNYVHDFPQVGGAHNDGIQGPKCTNVTFRRNIFKNNGMHIFLGDYEWNSTYYCNGITIDHNVFYNDTNGGSYNAIVFKGTNNGGTYTTKIENNTFNLRGQGSVFYLANSPSPGCCNNLANGYFRNNIIYSSNIGGSVQYYAHSYNTYYNSSGPTETGGLTSDPLFTDVANNNYTLKSGSPAINSGANLGYTSDFLGNPIEGTPDRGAFEYASGGTTPPSVSLTAPAAGATVSGSATISATASDNTGVASVDFRVDGATIATDSTSPYSVSWNTTSASNGSHALTAVARDAAGNQTTSSAVSVTVNNTTTPPPGDTTAPSVPTGLSASAVSSSQINLSWSASTDNVGVTGYDVYRGGTLLASVTGTSWENTGLTANTAYSYQVRAKDAAGNVSALSAQVSATTQGTTTPPPTTGQTIWGNTTPSTSAADNSAWELGTIFTPSVSGTVTAIRFYAASGETGAHTARLWSGSSVIGGPYTVTGTGPGWITYTLPTPVALTANTAYTVSVSTGADSGRRYAYSANALTGGGNNGANLTYPANAGVYSASIGSRPTSSWNSSNYFRDIVFTPSGTTPPPSTDPVTLFTDSFEQSLSWTKAGDTSWYTGSPKAGTHSVRLRRTGSIEKAVSLAGYKSASVSFKMGANSLDGSEYAQALYYNGSSWVELARINNGSQNENKALNPYTVALPAATDNLASFALRFKLNGSGTGDYLYVDDVTVTATPATVASAADILPPPTQNPILVEATPITQPLAEGMERPEVATLQKVLNQSPETQVAAAGAGSPGLETSYFGSLTTKAVQKFQALHNIVTAGSPSTTGFGRVGPKTLLKLRELLGL